MVSSEKSHPVGPPSFEHHEPGEGLEAVVAAVHEVAHEDVVGVGAVAAGLEQRLQVVELAVDVAADRDRRGDRLDVGLLQEKITDQVTQLLQLRLGQIFAVLQGDGLRLVSSFYRNILTLVISTHLSTFPFCADILNSLFRSQVMVRPPSQPCLWLCFRVF